MKQILKFLLCFGENVLFDEAILFHLVRFHLVQVRTYGFPWSTSVQMNGYKCVTWGVDHILVPWSSPARPQRSENRLNLHRIYKVVCRMFLGGVEVKRVCNVFLTAVLIPRIHPHRSRCYRQSRFLRARCWACLGSSVALESVATVAAVPTIANLACVWARNWKYGVTDCNTLQRWMEEIFSFLTPCPPFSCSKFSWKCANPCTFVF